uniref:Uncharacterized protein n=1 Tax=Acrobeloides nanus TaxID=290746 RepID=A0A914DQZ4_9BILA
MESDNSEKGHNLIHQLSEEVSRSICTGQVVISLSGACRELIDNALDAGATNIDVRVKENGTIALEVNDNGTGIDELNFPVLCKPHATSKLSSVKDFDQLSTFGFRGEALNALAALSDVTIVTKHTDAKLGSKLRFDNKGEIISKETVPRQVGTTIIVENLFKTLPVRRQEFVRNSRKEFLKMLNVIQTFALSRCDLRFICSNTVNGKRIQMIATPGGTSSIVNVCASLFGVRAEKGNILEIEEAIPDDEVRAIYGLQDRDDKVFEEIKIYGYISSCEVGHGRHSADRQFVYVNHRPVDYSKVCKIANSVYQQFNRGQYCMLILFIEVDPAALDVNVSPDKRTVFLHEEKRLFAKFHASLLKTFSQVLGSCKELPNKSAKSEKKLFNTSLEMSPSSSSTNLSDGLEANENNPSFAIFQSRKKKISENTDENIMPTKRDRKETDVNHQSPRDSNVLTLDKFAFKPLKIASSASQVVEEMHEPIVEQQPVVPEMDFRRMKVIMHNASVDENSQQVATDTDYFIEKDFRQIEQEIMPKTVVTEAPQLNCDQTSSISSGVVLRAQQMLFVDFRRLRKSFQNLLANSIIKEEQKSEKEKLNIEKSADVLDENQPETIAEEHLRLIKDDFAKMEVVGQFNNAFIFSRLNNQMFMIDQHAADEKYNFESFQRRARVQNQQLICPQKLKLGALHEAVLRDNIEIFRYNGFDFRFDEDGEVGQRIQLISIPVLN